MVNNACHHFFKFDLLPLHVDDISLHPKVVLHLVVRIFLADAVLQTPLVHQFLLDRQIPLRFFHYLLALIENLLVVIHRNLVVGIEFFLVLFVDILATLLDALHHARHVVQGCGSGLHRVATGQSAHHHQGSRKAAECLSLFRRELSEWLVRQRIVSQLLVTASDDAARVGGNLGRDVLSAQYLLSFWRRRDRLLRYRLTVPCGNRLDGRCGRSRSGRAASQFLKRLVA